MKPPDQILQALISAEATVIDPPHDAVDAGWQRLVEATRRGHTAPDPAPTPRGIGRRGWLGIVLVVSGLGALGLRGRAEPVAARLPRLERSEPLAPAPTISPAVPDVAPPIARAPQLSEASPAAPIRPDPRRPRAEAAAPDEDSFAAELRLLAAGQSALQSGDITGGLRLLRSHATRYPAGHFAQDRDALLAIGQCEGGRRSAGRTDGRRFLRAHPDSIHAERVRDTCDLQDAAK